MVLATLNLVFWLCIVHVYDELHVTVQGHYKAPYKTSLFVSSETFQAYTNFNSLILLKLSRLYARFSFLGIMIIFDVFVLSAGATFIKI